MASKILHFWYSRQHMINLCKESSYTREKCIAGYKLLPQTFTFSCDDPYKASQLYTQHWPDAIYLGEGTIIIDQREISIDKST